MTEMGRLADGICGHRRSGCALDFGGLGKGECVIDVHAQVANRVLDFSTSKQIWMARRFPVALHMSDVLFCRIEWVPYSSGVRPMALTHSLTSLAY